MNELVYLAPNTKEPFTTSEVIAECARVKHHAIQQLIQKHETDFKSFGVIAFEMRKPPTGSKGGSQRRGACGIKKKTASADEGGDGERG